MTDKLIGFCVSGFTGENFDPSTSREIAVLATDAASAVEAVQSGYENFTVIGVHNEQMLREALKDIEDLRAQVTKQ